ncbi:MAG TPA: hypothetical protein VHU87_01645 [Rhizomicrobium sp.]|nr:hypothetical protein [Rhizomicrobium sp.]
MLCATIPVGALAGARFSTANPAPVAPSGMILYHDAHTGFAIAYPPHWSVNPHFRRDTSPPVHGVSFTVAAARVTGTNLGADTKLIVEHVAGPCNAARFLDAPQDLHSETDGARSYSVATENDAGAGNRYEETVYALTNGTTCFGIRYFIHYAAIENFEPGSVKAFDRDALIATFDRMRRSLAFTD